MLSEAPTRGELKWPTVSFRRITLPPPLVRTARAPSLRLRFTARGSSALIRPRGNWQFLVHRNPSSLRKSLLINRNLPPDFRGEIYLYQQGILTYSSTGAVSSAVSSTAAVSSSGAVSVFSSSTEISSVSSGSSEAVFTSGIPVSRLISL